MTLNVLGTQATVSGTISVPGGTNTTGEITVLTTASTADYTAIVTLSLSASSGAANFAGGFSLPGAGGGATGLQTGGIVYSVASSGAGVAVVPLTSNHAAFGASSVIKVGPGVAIKVPYSFAGSNTSSTVSYVVNAHVAYIRNP